MRNTSISLFTIFLAALLLSTLASCARPDSPPSNPSSDVIILATTTSTQDSGLLDVLIPAFEKASRFSVKTIAVGSGQALEMAARGDADILLVHAPSAERELMEAGYGVDRRLVMHNDFVLVGPPQDPAGLRQAESAADALRRLQAAGSPFVSRGDESGTHLKERALWQAAGGLPSPEGYQESGQGMGATLLIASEKGAYTLSDRATYLAFREQLNLEILVEGDPDLLNVYHVIRVNPQKWPSVNVQGAIALADFLTSPKGQALIALFGVEEYGQALFFADAGKSEAELGEE